MKCHILYRDKIYLYVISYNMSISECAHRAPEKISTKNRGQHFREICLSLLLFINLYFITAYLCDRVEYAKQILIELTISWTVSKFCVSFPHFNLVTGNLHESEKEGPNELIYFSLRMLFSRVVQHAYAPVSLLSHLYHRCRYLRKYRPLWWGAHGADLESRLGPTMCFACAIRRAPRVCFRNAVTVAETHGASRHYNATDGRRPKIRSNRKIVS